MKEAWEKRAFTAVIVGIAAFAGTNSIRFIDEKHVSDTTPEALTTPFEPESYIPTPTKATLPPVETPMPPATEKFVSRDDKFEMEYNPNDWVQGKNSLLRHGVREYMTKIKVTSEPVSPTTTLEDFEKIAIERSKKMFGNDDVNAVIVPDIDVNFNGYQAKAITIISPPGIFGPATQASTLETVFMGRNGRAYTVIFSAESSTPQFFNAELLKAQSTLDSIRPTP